MTQNGIETINIVKSIGLNPMDFTKENAANVQKLVAFKNEGMCDLDFVKSHISLTTPTLSSEGIKEVEDKIFALNLLRKYGVDERTIEAIGEQPPSVVQKDAVIHLFYTVLDVEEKFTTWDFSPRQKEWIVRFLLFGGKDFAVKYCDPSIKEDELRKVFLENRNLF